MNSGAALWQSSGRPLPHLPQPYHQRQSLFSQPTTTTTRPITTPSTSFSTHNNQPFTPKRKFTTTATPQPTAIPTNPESIASMAKKTVKPHDGTKLYPREVWEGLVTESTVRLNKYLEIISANDRRASGLDNNRQMWASQRISPAILHDRFRFVSSLPTMARSQALLSLWLSAANFKSKLPPQSLAVNAWLSTLILLVMGMVSAGGITRLTRSGLSMTTWKFTGEKRPTNESEWEEEFDLYKQSPEYRLHNSDMEIKDFKFIYHMEYGHRTLGRVIGVAFTVPLLLFIANKSISMRTGFGKALVGVLSLGGVQGLIGWWMVKSGLDEKTNVEKAKVSPYRLATHLSIAFTLLVGLTVLKLRARHGIVDVYLADKLVPKSLPNLFGFKAPKRLAHATSMIAFFTAMTGAFVAGNDAGLVYNEWPEMGEGYIPGDLVNPHLSPIRNLFENPTLVQFIHRNMAYTTFALSWLTSLACMINPAVPAAVANAANRTAFFVSCQALLGIYTLLNHVPVESAALHQFGAMLVLMSATQTMFYTLNPLACVSNLSSSVRTLSYDQNARFQTLGQVMQTASTLQGRDAEIDKVKAEAQAIMEKKRMEVFDAAAHLKVVPLPKLTEPVPARPITRADIEAAEAELARLGEIEGGKKKGFMFSIFKPKESLLIDVQKMQIAEMNAMLAASESATAQATAAVSHPPLPAAPTAAATTAAVNNVSKVSKSAAGIMAIVGVGMMVAPMGKGQKQFQQGGKKTFFD